MSKIIISENSLIHSNLQSLVQNCEMIYYAGLPGVGKSLLLQQTTLMAQQTKRKVHLLQLDIIRPAFETQAILTRYPETDGITHPAILKALGLWTRSAVLKWYRSYGNSDHILVGEVPLIGNRLMELVRPYDDEVEAILRNERTQFIIPVPTRDVRQVILGKRGKTIIEPQHEKENYDAPPSVLQALWHELHRIAEEFGFTVTPSDGLSYTPETYRAVYEHLLQYRNSTILNITEVFEPTGSVYDVGNIESEFVPTPNEVMQIISRLERDFTQEEIKAQVRDWYRF